MLANLLAVSETPRAVLPLFIEAAIKKLKSLFSEHRSNYLTHLRQGEVA